MILDSSVQLTMATLEAVPLQEGKHHPHRSWLTVLGRSLRCLAKAWFWQRGRVSVKASPVQGTGAGARDRAGNHRWVGLSAMRL